MATSTPCGYCGANIGPDVSTVRHPCGHAFHYECGIGHHVRGSAHCTACPPADPTDRLQELEFGDDRRRRRALDVFSGMTEMGASPFEADASGANALREKPRGILEGFGLAKIVGGASATSLRTLLKKKIPASTLYGDHGASGDLLTEKGLSISDLLDNAYGIQDFQTLRLSWPQLVAMGLGSEVWKKHRERLLNPIEVRTYYAIDFLDLYETCECDFFSVANAGFSATELSELGMTGHVAVSVLGMDKVEFAAFPFETSSWKGMRFGIEHLKNMGVSRRDVSELLKWGLDKRDLAFESLFEDTFGGPLSSLPGEPPRPPNEERPEGRKRARLVRACVTIVGIFVGGEERPSEEASAELLPSAKEMFSEKGLLTPGAKSALKTVAEWKGRVSLVFSQTPPRKMELPGEHHVFVAVWEGKKKKAIYALGLFDSVLEEVQRC